MWQISSSVSQYTIDAMDIDIKTIGTEYSKNNFLVLPEEAPVADIWNGCVIATSLAREIAIKNRTDEAIEHLIPDCRAVW